MPGIVSNSLKRLRCACKWISNYFRDCWWRFGVNSRGSEIGRFWVKSLGYSLWFWRWRTLRWQWCFFLFGENGPGENLLGTVMINLWKICLEHIFGVLLFLSFESPCWTEVLGQAFRHLLICGLVWIIFTIFFFRDPQIRRKQRDVHATSFKKCYFHCIYCTILGTRKQ